MKTRMFKLWGSFASVFGVVFLPRPAFSAGDWWFEVAPTLRTDMRISVSGSSYVQQLGLHDPMASGPLSPPTGAGNPAAYANRTYDNGYVNLDPGTGNPVSLDPNTTWNWGFNNPSQYNAGAQTLNYQSTGRPGYTTLENSGAGGRDSLLAKGIQVVIGRSVMQSDNWSLDFFMAFQGTWSQHEHLTISTY